jgi:F-type H+-transporting ATPase subunit gamma
MNMVASARLRGAQSRMERFRPYTAKFREMLLELSGKTEEGAHPLLAERPAPETCGIILATSDRGLCGGFNAGLIAEALRLARKKEAEGLGIRFYNIGRKGREAIKKIFPAQASLHQSNLEPLSFQTAGKLGEEIIEGYLSGLLDQVFIVYGEFVSLARQTPRTRSILPLKAPESEKGSGGRQAAEYLYEPGAQELLAELLPRYIKVLIYHGLLDTSASEHAARMTAMDNATRNCDEIAESLTLLYNKTRQSAITTDLIDIVSGAEALKG